MFTKTLFGNTKSILAVLGNSHLLDKAYLAGGTACALQLGHRISVDLDFFTPEDFDTLEMISKLEKTADFEFEESAKGTILGTIKDIKFSLFFYKHKVLFPFKDFAGINVLDLRDIAAMKIVAISDRGVKRDFIDLYFLCQKIGLEEILEIYDKKYSKLANNIIHIQKSLLYFIDVEKDVMPRMLKPCKWEDVKKFFEQEVRRMVAKNL